MSDHWVVNASPLILLCKVEQQQLLFDLSEQIVVPQAVKSLRGRQRMQPDNGL